ncbi:MAG: acyl-CoA dehydratase activase, partial [Candidatus Freyarchaeota archaeon]
RMVFAGCDVGTLATKAVLVKNGEVIAYSIIPTEARAEQSAKNAMSQALSKAGLSTDDVEYCVACGWGAGRVPFANETMSEMRCGAAGAHWLLPSARTVIDAGGLITRVVHIDEEGRVIDYVVNDKCASGSGRFLEIMAEALELKPDDFDSPSFRSANPVNITSQCSVFAESEVITYVNEGAELADIVSGINKSIALRVSTLVGRLGVVEDVTMIGGIAKNQAVVERLEEQIGVRIKKVGQEPQIVQAIGAALIAQTKEK